MLKVRFALVGEAVYHKWTCDTETTDTFCMTVYGCFVDDGTQQDTIQLLDDEGCAFDKSAALLYSTDYCIDKCIDYISDTYLAILNIHPI